jgi:RNA polymerase primary sigma factor
MEEKTLIELYCNDIRSTLGNSQFLSQEEEISLSDRIQNYSDKSAYDQLVNSNLRYVISTAKLFKNRGLEFVDLISEGNLGLMKAAKKFDGTKGVRFETYATWWIQRYISKAINDKSKTIRIPESTIKKVRKGKVYSSNFFGEHKRFPTLKETAEVAKIPYETLDKINKFNEIQSLDNLTSFEVSHSNIKPLVAIKYPLVEEEIINKITKEDIIQFIDSSPKLKKMEKKVIKEMFGILGDGGRTLEELALKYDVSPEWIRILKEKAFRKLRQDPKNYQLISYLKEQ